MSKVKSEISKEDRPMATKYHVCGVIEVDVVAENAEAALDLAETRIYRALDRSAKKLNAVIGLDIAYEN